MRNSPHRIALNLVFAALLVWKRGAFGGHFIYFGVWSAYLPVLVMGQTVYWWISRERLSAPVALGYLAAAYGVFLYGVRAIQPAFLPVTNSYPISVAYALLIFLTLVRVRLPPTRVVRFLSDTSYSLYLLHGIAAPLVRKALDPRMPLWAAILAAAATSLAAAAISYRWVERPFQGLARRLSRGKAATEALGHVESPDDRREQDIEPSHRRQEPS
jgi:peptidoglycan/LPS O-acetylase OafA/YrhL